MTEENLRERIAALTPQQRDALLRSMSERRTAAEDGWGADGVDGPTSGQQTIPRRPVARAPLGFAQQRMLFIDQLDPGNPAYNVAMGAPVDTALDPEIFRASLAEVIRRHEAMRTTFDLSGDDPVQVIHPELTPPLEFVDLSDRPEAEKDEAARTYVDRVSRTAFDLQTGPVLTVTLLRLAPERHVVIAAAHHIMCDTTSMQLLLSELSTTYAALAAGEPVGLDKPPLQYADFTQWEQETLTGDVLAEHEDFWRSRLGTDIPALDLPFDRPRGRTQSYAGAQQTVRLPEALSVALDQLGVSERVTQFVIYLTAIGAVLHRYSGQDVVTVGAPVSARSRPELQHTVGYLGNTVLLQADFTGDPTGQQALRRTQEAAQEAFAHQDLPFEKVVELVRPTRDLSRAPLLQVVLVDHAGWVSVEDEVFQGLGDSLGIDNGTSKFDISFVLDHSDRVHRLNVEYSTELFDDATIRRLVKHVERMLQAMVDEPATAVGAINLLDADERDQVVRRWNRTDQVFPDACLHELVAGQAATDPDRTAVVDVTGTLSYGQLQAAARRVAGALATRGAGPERPVAVALSGSRSVAVGLLGILTAGSPYLPLGRDTPVARIAAQLQDAGARLLLTEASRTPQLDGLSADDVEIVLLDELLVGDAEPEPGSPAVLPENLAYVIFTSGSTGRPKGVLQDHRGRVNNFSDFNRRYAIGPTDSVLALAPLAFDMSAYDTLGTLMAGGRVIYPPTEADRDPQVWLRLLREHAVTVWHSVPALLEMLVEYAQSEPEVELPALRLVLLGGDWISPGLPDRIRRLAPQAHVVCLGGATEVSMDSTVFDLPEGEWTGEKLPYGRPMANQTAYLLDAGLEPVPAGVAGDLYLGGVGVGRGYVGRPDLTATRFVPSPLPEAPGRIYRTGDRGRFRPDGTLELLGRSDHQIKIRGWRIEPGEIQAALTAYPGVREAVVVAVTSDVGVRELVGYLVAPEDLDLDDVTHHLGRHLPDYMVPATLLTLDALPLSPNGKIDRSRLPSPPARADNEIRQPPTNAVEQTLVEVWQELLGLEEVGIDDNFFTLGGDSIKTIQMVTRAKRRGLTITPRQLFEAQTVRELGRLVEGSDGTEPSTLDPAAADPAAEVRAALIEAFPDLEDAYLLPPMQRQMFDNAVHHPVAGLYIIQADYLFKSDAIDIELLVEAWQLVVDRHPSLRTSFHSEGLTEPVAVVHRAAPVVVEHHDLRGLSDEEQCARQDEIVAADRAGGFDLGRAPLVRLIILQADVGWKYISSNHHIVLDGWSRAIVQQEAFAIYQMLVEGRPVELAPFRSFKDYVAWVYGQDVAGTRPHWQRYLDGFRGPTPIVAARGRPEPTLDGPFSRQMLPVDAELTQRLRQLGQDRALTMNTIMQGAWLLLTARYTDRSDVVLGVMSSGRPTELADVDTMVGVCVNMLPVRARIDPAAEILNWLGELQQQQAELREMEFTPLSTLEEWCADGDRLFETLFVFENYPWDGSLAALSDSVDIEHPLSQTNYQAAQFEFPLRVEVAPKAPLLIMHYYQSAFADDSVTQMLADWAAMIDAVVAHPQGTLGDLMSAPAAPAPADDDPNRPA